MLLRSRIAPTPSGYLHTGNALNFVITWLWTRKNGGLLRLRIDDSDTTRAKPEFIEDIFRSLDWLGIDWDEGPQTPDEHKHIYSQALKGSRYSEMINILVGSGKVFACTCSRKDLLTGPCNCRERKISINHSGAALRIVTPCEPVIVKDVKRGTLPVMLNNEMKDFIISRRDGLPAYQVVSLADDMDNNINLVVRGNDLLRSTAAQLFLASLTKDKKFAETLFYHHPLLLDETGLKLSKSEGSLSLKAIRGQGASAVQVYLTISKALGLAYPCTSLKEMLSLPGEPPSFKAPDNKSKTLE